MKIQIDGKAKEIAALVVGLQKRQGNKIDFVIDGKSMAGVNHKLNQSPKRIGTTEVQHETN